MATYNNIKKIKIGDNTFNLYDSGNSGGTITSVKTTAGTHSAIDVSSGAVSFNVPTKTSHLTNDSGFVTTDEKVKVTALNSSNTYYPILASGVGTDARQIATTGISFTDSGGGSTLSLGLDSYHWGVLKIGGESAYSVTVYNIDITADRTITLPDKSGTVALTSDIPTTLPASDVSAWAKASTKPTYTASEVGALASNTTYVSKITTTAGTHSAISNKSGAVSFNVPTTAAHVGIKFGYTTSGNNRAVQQDSSGNLYVTQKDDNTIYYAGTGLALTNSTFTVHKAVLCAGGTEGTGTMALAAGTVTQIPMTRELLNYSSGGSIIEDITLNTDVGAMYIYNPGVYRITGSVFLAANSGNSRVQVFLRLGSLTDSFSSATEIARADSYLASGAVNVTRTIQLNDAYMLVYLGARVNDIAGKVYLGNVATYLEVERLSG